MRGPQLRARRARRFRARSTDSGLSCRRAIAEPGHVEQVLDVAVQPLALVADRLGEQLAAGAASAPSPASIRLVAAPMIETSGVRRSWLTEDSSAARSRSVSESSRRLLDVGWPAACARSRPRPGRPAHRAGGAARGRAARRRPERDAEQRRASLRRLERQEQPGRRQGSVAELAPGRLAMLPGPFAPRPVARVELVLGRIAAGDRRGARPRRARARASAHCSVERRGARPPRPRRRSDGGGSDLAAEVVEVGGPLGDGAQRRRLGAELAARLPVSDRDDEEEDERQDVLLSRDVNV